MMRMTSDYNIAIMAVIKMIVDNNAGCVSRKLKEIGYEKSKNFVPASELEAALFQLHSANRVKFFEVMKKCEWNFGNNNWTNQDSNRTQILNAVSRYSGRLVDKNNFWDITMDYLQKQPIN